MTYSCLLLAEHRAATTPRQRTLFWATFFNWAQVKPASFASDSTDLLQVCLGLPTFLFPCGFQSSACLVMFSGDLRRVWPIHPHFLLFISMLMGSCLVFSHRLVFDMVSGHLMLRIWRRHLLTKDWTFIDRLRYLPGLRAIQQD